jgi:protein-tyrosine phosphatase
MFNTIYNSIRTSNSIRTNNISNNYNKIIEYLFIGNIQAAELYSDRFALVVNCSKDIPFSPKSRQKIRIPINDDPSETNTLLNYMKNTDILEQIHTNVINKRPVLVHCFAGMQRSCAVVACYLIKYYNATPLIAINFIKKQRKEAFFGGVNFINTLEMFYATK